MPDIISRIKVEAQGADQAAREILKLRDAYKQAGDAARGLSATVGGGSTDPFAKATAAGGGATQGGGNSPADIAMREERTRNQRDSIRQREGKNEALSSFGPRGITQGMGVAESMAQGRGGSAFGGIAGGVGGLLGGPAGIALMAGAAVAMGIQKFADSSFGRLEETFGTGMSQRLGVSAQSLDKERLGFSRMGVPIGMVKSFFSAAGMSGVDMTRSSTQGAINSAMNAASMLGVDPNAMAGLIGSVNRAGVSAGVVNNGLFSMGRSSFGGANVSLFTQTLQSLVDSASARGIDLTSGSVDTMATNMALLAKFGGFSAPGAATFAQQLQNRGESAARLGSAEDIIAFQAMRESGASVTDTMLAMERNPNLVNQKVYNYLQGTTGGDEELMRFRLQQYLGPGTTMSQVDRFMKTQEATKGLSGEALSAALGANDQAWATPTGEDAKSTNIYQVRQNEMLKEFSDGMLDLTVGLTEALMKIFGTKQGYDPLHMTTEGYRPDLSKEIVAAVSAVNAMTIQDVGNLTIVLSNKDLSVRDVRDLERDIANPRAAVALSTAQALKSDPALFAEVERDYKKGGMYTSGTWRGFTEGGATIGGWGTASKDISGGILATLGDTYKKKDDPAAAMALKKVGEEYYKQAGRVPDDITFETYTGLRQLLEELLRQNGFVYTDGVGYGFHPKKGL